jgi:hypothetical protein
MNARSQIRPQFPSEAKIWAGLIGRGLIRGGEGTGVFLLGEGPLNDPPRSYPVKVGLGVTGLVLGSLPSLKSSIPWLRDRVDALESSALTGVRGLNAVSIPLDESSVTNASEAFVDCTEEVIGALLNYVYGNVLLAPEGWSALGSGVLMAVSLGLSFVSAHKMAAAIDELTQKAARSRENAEAARRSGQEPADSAMTFDLTSESLAVVNKSVVEARAAVKARSEWLLLPKVAAVGATAAGLAIGLATHNAKTHDRTEGDEFIITQALVAMLNFVLMYKFLCAFADSSVKYAREAKLAGEAIARVNRHGARELNNELAFEHSVLESQVEWARRTAQNADDLVHEIERGGSAAHASEGGPSRSE